jgi:hypothetical protein
MGFQLVIWFTGLFNLLITKNCSTIANSHTLQITVAHNESSEFVFTSGCLATDHNNVLFCLRCYQLVTVLHLAHDSKCPHILDLLPVGSPYTASALINRKHHFQQLVHYCNKRSLPWKRVYVPFPTNGCLFWLHYSGLSAAMSHCSLLKAAHPVYTIDIPPFSSSWEGAGPSIMFCRLLAGAWWKLLADWGLTVILGLCFHLIAGLYSQILAPKLVVTFSINLLICHSFRVCM